MATKANIVIDQGTTFNTTISLTDDAGDPLDLSVYSANGQIRKWYTSSNSTNFTITLSGGDLYLSLNSASTANLSAGRYVYDVILRDNSNTITRVVEGMVTVTPRVSR
jgi:hypothetical protein